MPLLRTNTADKFIVDRRKTHRNSDVQRAVRKTRERLSQRSGTSTFDHELLKFHARAIVASASAIPLLVLLIATGGLLAGMSEEILIWAVLTVVSYAVLAYAARRIDKADIEAINTVSAKRTLLLLHFISGLGWAYLAFVKCDQCQIGQFPVLKAILLILAMAATAIITSSLRGALLVTFALPVAVYGLLAANFSVPVETIMTGLLVVALPFFAYFAEHLNNTALMMLSFRSEKDALIVELETAKSMSDEARHRAEEANLAKSRFLASMSHELRTPLNAILGFSEVMAGEVLGPLANPTYREYASDIHDSGQHLLDLINEILDLSRVEAGRYQLNEEPVSLAGIAEDCCHMVALKARNKDLRIIQQFEPRMPRLFADERAIRQVMLNLLSNAIKFTPTGGEIRVKVGWTAGGGQYVAIQDNGPGIPPEEISVVMAAFGQGSIAIKSAEQGTGLGLPIVQGLMELFGGAFDLQSRLREGTEAIATFPATRVMEELPALPTGEASGGRRRSA